MFPVLLEIPNAKTMSGSALVIEIVIGIACGLAWLALYLRGEKEGMASVFNTIAILVILHLGLSHFMKDPSGAPAPVTIYSFGVMIILGFLAGCWYMVKQTDKLGLDRKAIFDWGFWMLIVGILGARFFYAYLNYEQFSSNKWAVFQIWNGGLVWYGGLIPGMIIGIVLLAKSKLPMLHVADLGSLAIILALGIGRWACLLAGDDYGQPTDAWYGIRFYNPKALVNAGIDGAPLLGVPLHPTQLYMSVNAFWLFFFLEWIRRRARYAGQAMAWMLILYAITRGVLIEPFRGDFVERNPGYQKHVATTIYVDKPEDSGALELARGATVRDATGRTGRLLEDLELPAGAAQGTVRAISDGPAKAVPGPLGSFAGAPEWDIDSVEGLPETATVTAASPRWYNSDLPPPPGYVSTSQWIGILIAIAGVLVLLLVRKAKVPGFAEATAKAQAETPEEAPDS